MPSRERRNRLKNKRGLEAFLDSPLPDDIQVPERVVVPRKGLTAEQRSEIETALAFYRAHRDEHRSVEDPESDKPLSVIEYNTSMKMMERKALRAINDILTNSGDKILKAKVAADVLDRVRGKAAQVVEVSDLKKKLKEMSEDELMAYFASLLVQVGAADRGYQLVRTGSQDAADQEPSPSEKVPQPKPKGTPGVY